MEQEQGLGIGDAAGGEQRPNLTEGCGQDADAFIVFKVLCGGCEGGGDERVHEFIGEAGGGVEAAQVLEVAGDETGFLRQFACRAQGRVFPGSPGARREFDHPLLIREPPILDENELRIASEVLAECGRNSALLRSLQSEDSLILAAVQNGLKALAKRGLVSKRGETFESAVLFIALIEGMSVRLMLIAAPDLKKLKASLVEAMLLLIS